MRRLDEDKKTVLVAIAGFAFLVVVGFIMLSALGGAVLNPVNVYFENPVVHPGNSTVLVIEVRNTGEEDAVNVGINVIPESTVLGVSDAKHVEEVIGAGSYRRIKFDVGVSNGATEGNYKVKVNVKMGEKTLTGQAFIEVNV